MATAALETRVQALEQQQANLATITELRNLERRLNSKIYTMESRLRIEVARIGQDFAELQGHVLGFMEMVEMLVDRVNALLSGNRGEA